jgi:anti-anti-sigma factor
MPDEERPYSAEFDLADARLTVHGEIGELDTADFRRDLLDAVAHTEQTVVVDLSDVDFLPSAAIGVLVGAIKGAAGQIELVAAKQSIAGHLLSICGLPFCDPRTLQT